MSFNSASSNPSHKPFLPLHGGALNAAAAHFGIPLEKWLDISTGINPTSWPVPEIPRSVWQRLPENQAESEQGLEQVALDYYLAHEKTDLRITQKQNLLPCSGSQQGIRLLPLLYNALQRSSKQQSKAEARVWVTSGSYAEHGIAWEEQGHKVRKVACDRISQLLTQQPVDVLILLNPDNPSGHRWPAEQLLKWWSILHRRGGWLIVDEAFMDTTPEHSLVPHIEREGLFVLRSLGKFFGLAGVRLGFVLAAEKPIARLTKMLGPWAVSHPAQYIGKLALQDQSWAAKQRIDLAQQSLRLAALLENYFPSACKGTDLFQTVYLNDAENVFDQLARQGVLTRYLPATIKSLSGLRFGLPDNNESSWQQLETALAQIKF